MNLIFCDICQESVPAPALLSGSAEKRGVRTICGACLGAMSADGQSAADQPAASYQPPRPTADSTPGAWAAWHASQQGAKSGATSTDSVAEEQAEKDAEKDAARRRRRRAIPNIGMSAMGVGLGSMAVLIALLTLLILQQDLADAEERLGSVGVKTEKHIKNMNQLLYGIDDRIEARLRDAAEDLLRSGDLVANGQPSRPTNAPRNANRDRDVDALAELVRELDHQVQILSRRLFDVDEGMRTELDGEKPAAPQLDQRDLLHAIEQLRDPDPRARLAGLFTVEAFEDPALTQYIAPLLNDGEAWIRLASVRAMERLGAVDACPDLIAALDDNDPRVRDAAVAGLRGITGEAFGYEARSSLRERRVAQGRWADWWRTNWKSLRYGVEESDEG